VQKCTKGFFIPIPFLFFSLHIVTIICVFRLARWWPNCWKLTVAIYTETFSSPRSKWAMNLSRKAEQRNRSTFPWEAFARQCLTSSSSGWLTGVTGLFQQSQKRLSSSESWTLRALRSFRCALQLTICNSIISYVTQH
jgi:hypothetical protein